MNKDQGELIEYLDGKFTKIDEKFEKVGEHFNEIESRIDKLENKFDLKFDQLLTAIDKLTKSIETYHHEQVALGAKVDRLEQWINQVAKHVGIELKP